MKFYVMTLFPQMILDGLNTSITGRAIESGALCVEAVDIRDFSIWRWGRHGHAGRTSV